MSCKQHRENTVRCAIELGRTVKTKSESRNGNVMNEAALRDKLTNKHSNLIMAMKPNPPLMKPHAKKVTTNETKQPKWHILQMKKFTN